MSETNQEIDERIERELAQAGIITVRPDERRREPVMPFANSIDPVDTGFKRGELSIIMAGGDQGRSVVQKHLEVEHAIDALGAVLYRHSPRYDYDGADRRDAMREAREIVTQALKGEGP